MFPNIMRKFKFYNGSSILYAAILIFVFIVFVTVNVKEIENFEGKRMSNKKEIITFQKTISPFKKFVHTFRDSNGSNKTNSLESDDAFDATKKSLTSKDAYVNYSNFIRHTQMVDEFISNFTILPSKICYENTTFLTLVNSRSGARTERSRIRSYMKSHKNVKLFFLVGKPSVSQNVLLNGSSLESKLADEAELEGDLIVPDLVDSYNSLTVKIGSGFLWVLKYCPQSDHVLKMDDDVFVNYKLLEESFQYLQTYSIYGKVCTNCIPFNPGGVEESEKLFSHPFVLTKNHFPLSQLPSFAFGPAYVIQTNLIPALLVTALELDALPYYEDVFWTGLTTADLKMKTQEDDFNLLNQINILKLQHRNRRDIVELLEFLERICAPTNSKFAVSSSTLSLLTHVDVPSWRVELHRCLKGRNCSSYATLHGVQWNDKTVSHVIRLL